MAQIEKMIAKTFMDIATGLETGSFGARPRIAVTGLGSEHGEANSVEAAVLAADRGVDVTLIGTAENEKFNTVKVSDEDVAADFFGAIAKADTKVVDVRNIDKDSQGLDCGPKTIELFKKELVGAKTVVWNGPAGVFEVEKFAKGTKAICEALANLDGATTIIGGGDSAAAAISMGYENKFTHISTGGGASLEYLEGKALPGVTCLSDVK